MKLFAIVACLNEVKKRKFIYLLSMLCYTLKRFVIIINSMYT